MRTSFKGRRLECAWSKSQSATTANLRPILMRWPNAQDSLHRKLSIFIRKVSIESAASDLRPVFRFSAVCHANSQLHGELSLGRQFQLVLLASVERRLEFTR